MPIVDRRRCVAIVMLLAVVALPACHGAQQAIAESGIERPAARLQSDRDSERPRTRPVAGATAFRGSEALPLPADFPADVFMPTAYTVNSVMDSGALQVVSLQAKGRLSGLYSDARSTMRAHGWTQTLAMQTAADSAMASFEKDQRAAVLSFNRGSGAGEVTMSVQLRRARQ